MPGSAKAPLHLSEPSLSCLTSIEGTYGALLLLVRAPLLVRTDHCRPLTAASVSVPSATGHLATANPDLIPASSCPPLARRQLSADPVSQLALAPAQAHSVALAPALRALVSLLQAPCSARRLLLSSRRLIVGSSSDPGRRGRHASLEGT